MARDLSQQVAVARTAAKSLGAREVIVFYRTEGQFGYASFGMTPAEYTEAQELADIAYSAIFDKLSEKSGGACLERDVERWHVEKRLARSRI